MPPARPARPDARRSHSTYTVTNVGYETRALVFAKRNIFQVLES